MGHAASPKPVIAWQAHEGPRVAQRERLRHHRLRDVRLPPCRAAARSARRSKREYRENYYTEEKPTFLAHAGEDQALGANWPRPTGWKLSNDCSAPARRRLLDIGCGPGILPEDRQGARLAGAAASSRRARPRRMRARWASKSPKDSSVRETAPALGRFDAINLNNVLEHVPDPIAILAGGARSAGAGRRALRRCAQ